tara:strand:- start:7566 stop:7994 length:429 start_codon:yes stop_codon:yes gene_type:complete
MRCNINSDNKNKMIETGIAFCSETGKRLDNVRYNPRDLVRSSACKNTWAQDVVKALFENEAKSYDTLISSAESVLSNLHSRVNKDIEVENKFGYTPENFYNLEKRSKTTKVRKVKKAITVNNPDGDLVSLIENLIEQKLAKI